MSLVRFRVVKVGTTNIFGLFSFLYFSTAHRSDELQFFVDHVDKFVMVFDVAATDVDSAWVDVFDLEFLELLGRQILNIGLKAQ